LARQKVRQKVADYMRFFREDTEELDRKSQEMLTEFHRFRELHPCLMKWVNKQADAPVTVDEAIHTRVVRANTFKEIREFITAREAASKGD